VAALFAQAQSRDADAGVGGDRGGDAVQGVGNFGGVGV
jgi:hypothetical protein